jgi:hypothetical protein
MLAYSYNLNQDLATGAAKNKNVYKLIIVDTSLGWTNVAEPDDLRSEMLPNCGFTSAEFSQIF